MGINRKAARKSFSCMLETNTWCWGDAEGNTLREGVHRYVKAVYFDAWDARATADDPYDLAVTGDLARVSFSGKAVTLGGPKECDRRLVYFPATHMQTTHDSTRCALLQQHEPVPKFIHSGDRRL